MSRYELPENYSPSELFEWRKLQKCIDDEFPIITCPEWFQNKFGMYRWFMIRAAYDDGIITADDVTELYQDWRDTSEYFKLDGLDSDDTQVCSVFVKAAKRGNDVYKKLVKQKFDFLEKLPPIQFFNDTWGRRLSPMLFVTLTVDTKKFTIRDAWHFVGEEFNHYETKLRQKYGNFVRLRVWEAHESGYPHIHVVYYFTERQFEVFETFEETATGALQQVWRIADKHRQFIKKIWSMGANVDVRAVQDTHGAFSEVKKYVTKTIYSKKGDKTNAMLTLFRKQAYSISQRHPFYKGESLRDGYNAPPILQGRVGCHRCGAPLDASDKIYYAHEHDLLVGYCSHCERLTTWVGAPKIEPKLLPLINAELEHHRAKDFIGSVWGPLEYVDFYFGKTLNLAEPGANALVKPTMCNYNIEFPEVVKWEFSGFISGRDLKRFYPDLMGEWSFAVEPPPSDLYCYVNMPLNCVGSDGLPRKKSKQIGGKLWNQ